MEHFAIDHPEHGPGTAARIMTDPRPSNLWSLRLDAGGTVRITAARDEISDWTNDRARREQEGTSMEASTPKTVSIRPAARLVEQAMNWAEVPLGDALKVEQNGTLTFNYEADDLNAVLSALTGLVLAAHATEKMVLPTNVQVLQGVLGLLRELSAERLTDHGQRRLEDATERLERVIGSLDSPRP